MRGDISPIPPLVEINPRIPFLEGTARFVRNMAEQRQLIVGLIQRDIRLRYRNSALGYFWSLLQPLGLSACYFLLYAIIAGKPEARAPLWIFLGVVTWSYFSKALSDSVNCLTRGESMIKQIYFPREIFAVTSTGSALVIAVLSLLVSIPLLLYYGQGPTVHLWMVPVGLVLAGLLALGVGLGVACLNVVNRDVEHFFRFLIRAGLFLSPVMWSLDRVPPNRAAILDVLLLNPLAVPITMVRNGIDGRALGLQAGHVTYSVAFCLVSFVVGTMVFKRYEAGVVKKI